MHYRDKDLKEQPEIFQLEIETLRFFVKRWDKKKRGGKSENEHGDEGVKGSAALKGDRKAAEIWQRAQIPKN